MTQDILILIAIFFDAGARREMCSFFVYSENIHPLPVSSQSADTL